MLTLKRNASKEEDNQHHIRKYGRNIHDLARRRDTLHHADVHQKPGGQQSQRHTVVGSIRLVDARRRFQRRPIPIVLRGRRGRAFRLHVVREVVVQSRWTVGPGQRRLEAMQQIDQAPRDDRVVVECDDVTDKRGRDADTAEKR